MNEQEIKQAVASLAEVIVNQRGWKALLRAGKARQKILEQNLIKALGPGVKVKDDAFDLREILNLTEAEFATVINVLEKHFPKKTDEQQKEQSTRGNS